MNNLGNLPVKILEKVLLNKPRWTSNPVKVSVGVAGTLLALSAIGVICLFSLSTHRPKTVGSKALIDAPVFSATKMTTPAERTTPTEMTMAVEKGDGGCCPECVTEKVGAPIVDERGIA